MSFQRKYDVFFENIILLYKTLWYLIKMSSTRFYFPYSTSSPVNPSFNSGWHTTSQAVRRYLSDDKGSSAMTQGTTITVSGSPGNRVMDRQYVSRSMVAQTISGTCAMQIMAREMAASDNVARMFTMLYAVSRDGGTVRGTLLTLDINRSTSTELLDTGMRNKTAIPSGTVVNDVLVEDGDRLVLEIGFAVPVGSTPEAAALWGENADDLPINETTTSNGAGWFEFENYNIIWPLELSVSYPSNTRGTKLSINEGRSADATKTEWNFIQLYSNGIEFTITTDANGANSENVLSANINNMTIWLPPFHVYLVRVRQQISGGWNEWSDFFQFDSRGQVTSYENYSILNADTIIL